MVHPEPWTPQEWPPKDWSLLLGEAFVMWLFSLSSSVPEGADAVSRTHEWLQAKLQRQPGYFQKLKTYPEAERYFRKALTRESKRQRQKERRRKEKEVRMDSDFAWKEIGSEALDESLWERAELFSRSRRDYLEVWRLAQGLTTTREVCRRLHISVAALDALIAQFLDELAG